MSEEKNVKISSSELGRSKLNKEELETVTGGVTGEFETTPPSRYLDGGGLPPELTMQLQRM